MSHAQFKIQRDDSEHDRQGIYILEKRDINNK